MHDTDTVSPLVWVAIALIVLAWGRLEKIDHDAEMAARCERAGMSYDKGADKCQRSKREGV